MLTENMLTEFKREYVDDIKNTVVAFANTDGGTLYIGVNDDGTVCGVQDIDGTMLRVTNALRDAVRPDITMFVECRNETMDGKPIIAVVVQRGTARPYYLHGKGIRPEGVYIRQGASTVPATDGAILSMIKETSGDSYEAARSLNQQLTFEKAAAYFKKRKVSFGPAQMRTLHLVGRDRTYTNLAFLLSDQCTHTIKLAVFEGSKKSVFKDRCELSGSILDQMEEAFRYIDRFNRTRAEFSGLDRIDMRDYPPEAVREALLNTLVHRDYSFSAPILISIFDDRMEFVSVGGLVKGISLEDVELGVSALRNPYLASVFYRLRLIEAYGTGILKINEVYDEYDVKPQIEATNNAFKVTLPNTNFKYEHLESRERSSSAAPAQMTPPKTREETILSLCRKNGSITRADAETALGISQSAAILLLRKLVEDGVLVKQGRGRNLRYAECAPRS